MNIPLLSLFLLFSMFLVETSNASFEKNKADTLANLQKGYDSFDTTAIDVQSINGRWEVDLLLREGYTYLGMGKKGPCKFFIFINSTGCSAAAVIKKD